MRVERVPGVCSLRASMAGRKPISDEQIELIKATFAETGNVRASARAAGVSFETARKYATNGDEFSQIRAQKRVDIIEKIAEAQIALLRAMSDQVHIAKASLNDLGITFGILTDKRLLLTGQATSRTENLTGDPAMRLTPDEMEAAAKIRAKLAAEVGV